jgi:hypothetical protein
MHGIPDFEPWYQGVQAKLTADPLAPFFVEIRNVSIHKGLNPLNQVTVDHLHEDLFQQMRQHNRGHVLVLPAVDSKKPTVLVDAVEASTTYFISLVTLIFECYDRFRCVVDPQWYFTRDNFTAMGKTFENAVVELGLPSEWALCAPAGDNGWRVLRLQQSPCQINDLFRKYIGREIPSPDDVQ